jgi:hypothetical protein
LVRGPNRPFDRLIALFVGLPAALTHVLLHLRPLLLPLDSILPTAFGGFRPHLPVDLLRVKIRRKSL